MHQRHRQTDRQQTDRQTDGRLIAYSERNVVRSLKIICRLSSIILTTNCTIGTALSLSKTPSDEPESEIPEKFRPVDAKYYDQHVCMFVCLFVCLSAIIFRKLRI